MCILYCLDRATVQHSLCVYKHRAIIRIVRTKDQVGTRNQKVQNQFTVNRHKNVPGDTAPLSVPLGSIGRRISIEVAIKTPNAICLLLFAGVILSCSK